jgi:putative membrane protein
MSRRIRGGRPLAAGVIALCLAGTGAIASARDDAHHARFSAWDEQWLMTAIEGDRFEIAGGTLATSQATNAQVRALAARLVKDHSASLKDAIRVARRLGIDVPDSPSPSQRWELKTVAAFAGADFDRRYADLEVLDHEQDIQESKDEVQKGVNRAVRHLARSDLPTLVEHLKLSRDALQAAGG